MMLDYLGPANHSFLVKREARRSEAERSDDANAGEATSQGVQVA
jgi:hypothetical protein